MTKEEKFEKEQLDKLISDLKDINQYTSFKNGSFIYDLGKYQGNLLINHIEKLEKEKQELIEYLHNKLGSLNSLEMFGRNSHNKEIAIVKEILNKIEKRD